jgi:Fic family protein
MEYRYIHQRKNWTRFTWDKERIAVFLGKVRYRQGRFLGKMEGLGFQLKDEALLNTLASDVVRSHEIEGEALNMEQVRSSIARRLGITIAHASPSTRHIDNIVEMMLDATQNYDKPLTRSRLFGWHAGLFPSGHSGIHKIRIGRFRTGDIEVVSGSMGKEKVHFEGPPAKVIENEMKAFLDWFNGETKTDPVIKAAIAHFWYVTIHPFEDGNGRIARTLADMQLCRADGSRLRFYSMSNQILAERKRYYAVLEETQHGNGDITRWLEWFLGCLERSVEKSEVLFEAVLFKAHFWEQHGHLSLNDRQRMMINKLMDNFEGKLSSSKWAKITKCSPDTALLDIQDLTDKGILEKEESGGRSTSYRLKTPDPIP